MAATPHLVSQRSVLVARSSSLSSGAIAGAVVGSVVGAFLLLLCFLPFIVRAVRAKSNPLDGPALAEMGQSLGGPISHHSPHSDDSSKRVSKVDLVPDPGPGAGAGLDPGITTGQYPKGASLGNGQDDFNEKLAASHQKPQQPSILPAGVTLHQGLPSPISPPFSPPSRHDSSISQAAEQALPPTDASSKSRYGSMGTLAKESSRELSLTDSYGPPSRELTGITSNGITEEPETYGRQSPSLNQHHISHIPGSIRNYIQRHRSSHHRRDSRRSTLAGTDGTRSPSIITNEVPLQPEPTPVPFEIDPDVRGEAWSYYNDPDLGSEFQASYIPTAPAAVYTFEPTSFAAVPPAQAPISTPFGTVPPAQRASAFPAGSAPQPISTRLLVEEPDAISPDSDKTVTPKDPLKSFSRQSSLLSKRFPGATIQRTDSLPPPTIVSDIPSPPLQLTAGPSGNPMDLMKPTNAAESAWKLEQDILKIDSPPPPNSHSAFLPPVDEDPSAKSDFSPDPYYQYQDDQYPPDLELNGQGFDAFDNDVSMMEYNRHDHNDTDWSTPPPSSGPSTSNTPDTRLTPYTASPSPRPDNEPRIDSQMVASPGQAGVSPSQSGASPSQSGASPRSFSCDQCHRVFDQIHKLNHHKRYHDKPHECLHQGCTMRFGTKTHLDRHINDKHRKTRSFHCQVHECPYSRQGGKSFPRKDNWRRHMINKHGITPDIEPAVQVSDQIMGGTWETT
ncbi:hypothetical protein B0T19DRAFT_53572 [Cercophora scortea]|uniref:C2H2-type domain-containing protein n=1 Tax=Cercophora scortea TaxID=314031 RepID=A0AAE0MMA1_9PEZI|nr:hypothetical protein B0T19DRAFT_53572 [Cercophora scortea]